ncbi:MAG: PEP-CTERM sorting domain-containing protein [Verrucomicrobiota bacterium]
MSPRNQQLSPRVNGRLVAYATLAGAALAAPALPTADADIIWSGPVNINIPSTTAGVYLNVQTGVSNPSPGLAPGWDVNPYGSTSLILFNPTAPVGGVYVVDAPGGTSATLPDNLPFGLLISAASGFGSGTGETTGPTAFVVNSSSNIVGFRFQNEAAANQTQYGWMRITLAGTTGAQPRAIVEYAYDNTGAGILAGAVPEPSSMALLGVMAAGALGVRAWRKRKA